ncbi:hypothetical protein [Pseudomonas sp. S1(2024)]|uniref:hypothetical protein n=1 Tax=Pseudomonas sp. S1(2024) TaxID=3390191 RepID=UPI00397A76E2
MKRTTLLIISLFIALFTELLKWGLGKFLDLNITSENTYEVIIRANEALTHITGKFAAGFILGALIFSTWDWPYVKKYLVKRQLKKDHLSDIALAKECENIAEELSARDAKFQTTQNEIRANSSTARLEDTFSRCRLVATRDMEKIQIELGQKVRNTIASLSEKGMAIDDEAKYITEWNLKELSYLFTELSNALIKQNYQNRTFKLSKAKD